MGSGPLYPLFPLPPGELVYICCCSICLDTSNSQLFTSSLFGSLNFRFHSSFSDNFPSLQVLVQGKLQQEGLSWPLCHYKLGWYDISPLLHCPWLQLFKIFFSKNWGIVVLQCCISFCCKMKWISHMYTYIPSVLRVQTPHPTPLSYHRAPIWAPCAI